MSGLIILPLNWQFKRNKFAIALFLSLGVVYYEFQISCPEPKYRIFIESLFAERKVYKLEIITISV